MITKSYNHGTCPARPTLKIYFAVNINNLKINVSQSPPGSFPRPCTGHPAVIGAEERIRAGVLVKVVVGFLGVLDMRTDFPTGWGCFVVLITRLVMGGLKI